MRDIDPGLYTGLGSQTEVELIVTKPISNIRTIEGNGMDGIMLSDDWRLRYRVHRIKRD